MEPSVVVIITFLILKAIFAEENSSSELDNLKKKNVGFIFEIPKTLVEGTNETVCISIHGAKLPAKAIIDLKLKEKHFLSHTTIDSDYKCFQTFIPYLNNNTKEPQYLSARVQIQLNGIIYSAHNHDPILIYPSKPIVFIEADRSLYKPGDTVKIRILVLNNDLLPPINYKIPQVKIRSPLDITMAVWNNLTADLGLSQLEFQLPKESSQGKWKIEALNEVQAFEVNKYVLPRFNINIIHPKIIYHEKPSTTFKVCSNYSYGQHVKGNALIKLTDTQYNMNPIVQLKKMKNGCAEFIVTREQLGFDNPVLSKGSTFYVPKIYILITATITEFGTNKMEVATARSTVFLRPYTLKFDVDGIFFPGLPYKGKIKLYNVNTDLSNEEVEVCYNLAIKKSWNFASNLECRKFVVGDKNVINFHILPLRSNVIHIELTATSVNHPSVADGFKVVRLYSSSKSYISLEEVNQENVKKCDSTKLFNVIYTTDKLNEHENVTFYYLIKSRGQINQMRKHIELVRKYTPNYENEFDDLIGGQNKYTKLNVTFNKFVLKIKLEEKTIATKYQLLVYYVTNSGETVAASKNVEYEPCLTNKNVQANWLQNQIRPGQTATLNVKTSSHSICTISASDKSTSFFNKNLLFNENSFLKAIETDREVSPSSRKTCVTPTKKNAHASSLQESMWDLKRRKRHVYSFSEDFDAYDMFNKFGSTIITNFKIVTKPCYVGPIDLQYSVQSLTNNYYEDQNEERGVSIRSYFPETWLWELLPIKSDESVHIRRETPHTVTNWVTNVYCISPTHGIGFAETSELSTFQPFFIDVLTPYSIKKEEHLYLDVLIFNYLNYSIPIKITLADFIGMRMVDESSNKSASYCLQSQETVTHLYILKAETVGETNITVVAELDPLFPGHCGPDTVVNKRDVVLKTVIIEPQGYPMKTIKSALLCSGESSNSNNISWDLVVPSDIVPYTAKAVLTLNGDLLGQTIDNLDDLVAMPTGCGEQIMATMAPNLYILKYLSATDKLTASLKQKAIRNIKIGYQRILNYVHKDGSFSAFGYNDPSGSMFLTTFVVRTLQDAKSYIYVDKRVIDDAVKWIFDHQLENGCFNTMLHVFQDMGGTSLENSTSSLTSYVIISLLEAKIDIPEAVKTNAKYCIRSHNNPDKYTLAISTYALFKVEWYSEADRALKRLLQIALRQNDMLWWSTRDTYGSVASDIEITGYVLLSLLQRNTTENLANAHSIVRWLSSKRGPHGGFKSTQDTVVALDALSKFASMVQSKKLDVNLNINARHQHLQLKMNENDRLKSKRIDLIETNNNIDIFVNGDGCILSQVVLSYNINNIPHSEAFKLAVDVSPVSTTDLCSIASLSPCLAYAGPDFQSNMAVLEVNLPSGYEADRASLYNLIGPESNTRVKMFEEINNKVLLYFTKVTKELICISFNINERVMVDDRQAATMKLYDYYKPEYEVVKYYRISKECQYNETSTLPEISEKAINKKKERLHILKDTIDFSSTLEPEVADLQKNATRRRRQGMNKDFVDMDVDMDVPKGMEANQPTYVMPPKISTKPSANTKGRRRKRQINFVNKDVKMEEPECQNTEYYVTASPKPNNSNKKAKTKKEIPNDSHAKNRLKRQIKFVNKDVNMETPDCEDTAYYVTSPPKFSQAPTVRTGG